MKKVIIGIICLVFLSLPYAYSESEHSDNEHEDNVENHDSDHENNSDNEHHDTTEKGDKGDKGEHGEDGKSGTNGSNGANGTNGVNGQDGKGLQNAYELQFEGVIAEGSRNAFSTYVSYDFNNENTTVGLKWKHYFGKSYSEQIREDLQRQINELKTK